MGVIVSHRPGYFFGQLQGAQIHGTKSEKIGKFGNGCHQSQSVAELMYWFFIIGKRDFE